MTLLKDIVQIEKGRKYNLLEENQEGAIRVFQANDFRNENKPLYTLDSDGVLVHEDDIMLVWDGSVGQMGIGRSGYVGSTMVKLKVKDKKQFSPFFIYRFLQTKSEYLKRKATGATIMHINRKSLEQLEIPDLEIDAQLHIANLLSKAENLIAQRKESIRLLDEFLKSTFLEMFGDPVRNEKGWEVEQLGKVTFMKAGQFVAASDIQSEFSEGLYSCYGGNGLRGYVKTYTHEGDFVLIGRQGALCGNVKIAKGQFHATEHAVVCSPKMQFETYWLYYLLDIINLNKYASGAAQPGLAVGRLEQIEIIYPPIELQTQFAQIVEKTEALKTQYQQSLQELENLYGSLSQRAFRGELTKK